MTDESDASLVEAFEATTLANFPHDAHVRVAWCYLKQSSLPEAMARFIAGIQRYAASKGAAHKYHETITIAWLLLIAERVGDSPDLSWPDFAPRYPELFDASLLSRYYRPDTLASERARKGFVWRDR